MGLSARQLYMKKYNKHYTLKHKDTKRAYDKVYRTVNKEKLQEQDRNKALKKKYGITFKQKLTMYEQQNGVCKTCLKSIEVTKAHTDHCHKIGKIRGLLCHNCNILLGSYEKIKDLNLIDVFEKYLKG